MDDNCSVEKRTENEELGAGPEAITEETHKTSGKTKRGAKPKTAAMADECEPDIAKEHTDVLPEDVPMDQTTAAKRNGMQNKEAAESGKAVNPNDILTLDPNHSGVGQEANARMLAWHELENSRIKSKILTGTFVSYERFMIGEDQYTNVAVVEYKDFRVIIPAVEMNIIVGGADSEAERNRRVSMIIASMVGCEIDFVVQNLDEESHSVVASRKRAMERKVNDFYIQASAKKGRPMIVPGEVVEARVVAVQKLAVRLEVFGAECFVRVFDLSTGWMEHAKEKYFVGQKILVRVSGVDIIGPGSVNITVEGKSLQKTESYSCTKQSKYMGKVTGFSKGTYFLRLKVGTNAVAHSCDGVFPLPKEGDIVNFVCTRMDDESHVAIGIIVGIVHASI